MRPGSSKRPPIKNTLFTVIAIILLTVVAYLQRPSVPAPKPAESKASSDPLAEAIEKRLSDVPVEGQGEVVRVLSDDNDGSRHQRFVIRLDSGATVLIAHNIDVATRIPELRKGDMVSFAGEYVWNAQGGVVHWTHRDPAGRHRDGWLRHHDQLFQ